VVIVRRLLRVDRSGRLTVRVRCPASTSTNRCRGSVRVVSGSLLLARRTFSIAADRTTTLRLTLTRRGRALLRRKSRIRVNVTVQTRGKDGVLRKRTERLTVVRSKS
jgi:hypothetical protein